MSGVPVMAWVWGRRALACFLGALVLTIGRFFWAGTAAGTHAGAEGLRVALTFVVIVLLAGGVVSGTAAILAAVRGGGIVDGARPAARLGSERTWAVALPLGVANLVVIADGAPHILVWNPLARVPGRSLDQIYAEMAAMGEGTLAGGFVSVWAGFWAVATVAYLVMCAVPMLRPVLTRRRVAVLGLLLIAATCAFAWIAGFHMGMSLADAFLTGGGDAALSGPVLMVFGQLSLVAALFIALAPARARAEESPAAPASA